MTLTKTIPAERLSGLDFHPGDTVHVISVNATEVLVKIDRHDGDGVASPGRASDWIRSARGSVRVEPGESAEDVRQNFYAVKYGAMK